MTDDIVKRWDDYVESMGCVMGEVEHMAQQMADTITALRAEVEKVVNDNETQLNLRLDAEIAASKIGWQLQKERQQRIAAEAERDRLRQLLQYVMDNRGECYIPSSNGWWDEAVQAAITTKGDADAG